MSYIIHIGLWNNPIKLETRHVYYHQTKAPVLFLCFNFELIRSMSKTSLELFTLRAVWYLQLQSILIDGFISTKWQQYTS